MVSRLLFHGKTVIITGAGGGLGRVYALEFARRGANILVNDIATASDVVNEIIEIGGKAVANNFDVTQGESIVQHAMDTFGDVHILVNNAGILRDRSFQKQTKADWDDVMNVHMTGTFRLCHAVWPIMQKNKFGRIITVGSGAGLYGNFGQSGYSAAKMGILGLTKTLSIEGLKNNIHVNCVVPVAKSRMTETILPKQVLDILAPEDIAPIVTYLSHESCEETGGCFEVGGGWYSKVRIQRSAGVKLKSIGGQPASAEDVATHFSRLSDFDSYQASYPISPADALRAIMTSEVAYSENNARTGGDIGSSTASIELDSRQAISGPSDPPLGFISHRIGVLQSDALFDKIMKRFKEDPESAKIVAQKVRANVQFEISNASIKRTWYLGMAKAIDSPFLIEAFDSETAAEVTTSTSGQWKPSVTLRCSDETFVAMGNGSLSPEFAYMTARLKIIGSMGHALKVKGLLELTASLS